MLDIFIKLYESDYPIEKIWLVDEYNTDDEMSMRDNNSSCFNFRFISHTNKISKHGLGLAVDINTLYNPYIKEVDGKRILEPATAEDYVDRSKSFPCKIDQSDLCYKLFVAHEPSDGGWDMTIIRQRKSAVSSLARHHYRAFPFILRDFIANQTDTSYRKRHLNYAFSNFALNEISLGVSISSNFMT